MKISLVIIDSLDQKKSQGGPDFIWLYMGAG